MVIKDLFDNEPRSFVTDELWTELRALIAEHDPYDSGYTNLGRRRTGPKRRVDIREIYEALLYREMSHCSWATLAKCYGLDDNTLYQRHKSWMQLGLLDMLYTHTLRYLAAQGKIRIPLAELEHDYDPIAVTAG